MTVRSIYNLCITQNDLLQDMMESGRMVVRSHLEELGPLVEDDSAPPVTWVAVNQCNQERQEIVLPRLMAGDHWFAPNYDPDVESPLVDGVTELVGGSVTIFQRMNEQGDMLRVSSNVMGADGNRAVGTFIPARRPDGTPNPVVASVLRGEIFRGRAFVVDRWCLTVYEPLMDKNGRVSGIAYFGVPMKQAEILDSTIEQFTIGKTGYAFVLDGLGKYVVSQHGSQNGQAVADVEAIDGSHPLRDILTHAKQASLAKPYFRRYQLEAHGSDQSREKVAASLYFEPWDWTIGAVSFVDEMEEAETHINANTRKVSLFLCTLSVMALVLAGFLAFLIGGRITKPLEEAVAVSEQIALGDFRRRLNCSRPDELGELARALDKMSDGLERKTVEASRIAKGDLTLKIEVNGEHDGLGNALKGMADGLRSTLADVRRASDQVGVGSREVSNSGALLADGATRQAASLEQVSSTMNELADRVKANSDHATEADRLTDEASDLGGEGVKQMDRMVASMSEINESSEAIAKIIRVIDDIAFQTNLLALNAAVEAARAGKHGKGFAVVAEEVRNLAGRSARAARETSEMIERSREQVAAGAAMAKETSEALNRIVRSVDKAARLVREIAADSLEQSEGIQEVTTGLSQIGGISAGGRE